MADVIQLRRDTAANWTSVNPILHQGEKGIETDTKREKTGDGTTIWNSLAYDPNSQVIAYYTDSDSVTPSTIKQRIYFNTKVRDSYNTVTTGSSWEFTSPYLADYQIVFGSVATIPSSTIGYVLVSAYVNNIAIPEFSAKRIFIPSTGCELDGTLCCTIPKNGTFHLEIEASGNTGGNFANRYIYIKELHS